MLKELNMQNMKTINNLERLNSNSGFTLIEILIVVSIIALMSSLGLINFKNLIDRSKDSAVLAEMRQYGNMLSIAKGDTGVVWRLQDLQSATMPTIDVYGRPINVPAGSSFEVNTSLWKGPYVTLQNSRAPDNSRKVDSEGYPIDVYGNRYMIALLKVQSGTTTLMDPVNYGPSDRPDLAMVVSYGRDRQPGHALNNSVSLTQKKNQFWLYVDETDSDDLYYKF